MSKHRISYIKYNDTSLVIRVDGKHRSFQDEDPERINEIYEAAIKAKEEDTDEAVDELMSVISPITRYQLEGVVEVDSEGNAYFGNTNVPMPEELGELIISFSKEDRDITPLVNFWQLCLLNPNHHARDNFFKYVRDYGIVITDNGYVILYKALNKKSEGKLTDFSDFVGEQYLKVKRQKKAPSNYEIYAVYSKEELDNHGGDFSVLTPKRFEISTHSGNAPEVAENETFVEWCNLEETYNKISQLDDDRKTTYKPWYSGGSYGNEVQLGTPVTMPREECDPSINASCSKGLHVGSFSYVSRFGRGMDSVLAILVNPKDIVALPKNDNSKIRTCKYYPYAVMERDEEGNWEELEEEYFEEDYAEDEISDIKERLKEMYSDKSKADLSEEEKAEEAILNSRLVELENN